MKIKKKYLYVSLVLAIILIVIIMLYSKFFKENIGISDTQSEDKEELLWMVDDKGYLFYPLNRGDVPFRREDYETEGNLSIHKIIYQSKNGNIYGLLVLPTSAAEILPGIILLPGAGVGKESELELAKKIAALDAAVLVIDQRGVGETNGKFPNLDEDYASFTEGKEPYQHLMVYDALRAFDLMKSTPFTDSERIIIAGESLGGRIAVIAAALDRNIKGVLLISSAGLDFIPKGDLKKDVFLQSIDSDHYIDMITPRRLVMIHNYNDNIIPINSAIKSFGKAQEPKQFIMVNDTSCNHGYCDSMYNGLVDALDYLVGIKSKTLVSLTE